MATVINNPTSEGGGAGTIIGIVLAIIIVALLFIYLLPRLQGTPATNTTPSANINVSLPSADGTSGDGTYGQ
jgi:hypothetical protein